ncbi:MAG TPA: type III pantothenate kinase [Opitutales bacterium]|nr:type III pantothenate kinase [Opitutales bacterium]
MLYRKLHRVAVLIAAVCFSTAVQATEPLAAALKTGGEVSVAPCILCLDVGNTDMLGGVYAGDVLKATFRYSTEDFGSADQLGLFLLSILKQNGFEPHTIQGISMGSVVPDCNWVIQKACGQYLPQARYYELNSAQCNATPLSPLRVKYKNGHEVGSDLIANALGAIQVYPGRNLLIVDMGTATTVCAVTKNKEFLGGAILPGASLWAQALSMNTAQLPEALVSRTTPLSALGTSTTVECIQSGIYYGQLGAIKEIIMRSKAEFFKGDTVMIIGTGGCASRYTAEKIFDHVMPELVLQGLLRAYLTLGQQ